MSTLMIKLFFFTFLSVSQFIPISGQGMDEVIGKKCKTDKDCKVSDIYCFGQCFKEKGCMVACESQGKGEQ